MKDLLLRGSGVVGISNLKISCCYLADYVKEIYVIHLPGVRPRAVLKTSGTVSSNTDRPWPVNNIFISFFPRMKARSEWSESCWLVRTAIFLFYGDHKTANEDIRLVCSYVFNISMFTITYEKTSSRRSSRTLFLFNCFPLVGLKCSFAHLPSLRHRHFAVFLR